MIDTHCHLTDPRLHSQLADVLAHAARAGVSRMITIGTDLLDSRGCLDVCKGRDYLRCAVGVHPSHVNDVDPADLPLLREIQAHLSVVAIGEIGLDYSRGKNNRQRQIDFFRFQLSLAAEFDRPLVIHCRDAIDDCLAILNEFPNLKAVFHCFTGTLAEGTKVLDAGYLLGFTGVITFKNTDELREVVKLTPIDRLLVETDSPYLSPEPMRGQKVNEPALVIHVANKVAQLKGLSHEEVDAATTVNANRLFRWP